MIEKMKMVYVVSSLSQRKELLDGLRNLGILHIAEKKSADRKITERFAELSKTAGELMEYAPDKKSKEKKEMPVLSDEEFGVLYERVKDAFAQKAELEQTLGSYKNELDRIREWGDFSPALLKELKASGFDLHFYKIGKSELEALSSDDSIRFIHLSAVDKMDAVAVIGSIPAGIQASEFSVPEKGISEIEAEMARCDARIKECVAILKDAAS